MNTNPVTQKQLDYINTLKTTGHTSFLSGTVNVYNRINQHQGHIPETIAEDIRIGTCDLSINERIIIPAHGELTPVDVIKMKNAFDSYIADYTPETTVEASAVIDTLKGNANPATLKFIFGWLSRHYTVTSELQTEGYLKGMTIYYIGKEK